VDFEAFDKFTKEVNEEIFKKLDDRFGIEALLLGATGMK